MKLLIFALTLFLSVPLFAERPNIVFFLADDMGYADLGCYGADDVESPHIDKLAATGVKFTNAYAMGAECTPSRTSILTGRYPQRFKGMECAIGTGNVGRYDDAIAKAENDDLGLAPADAILAPALKDSGYYNGVFGKWHLGYEKKFSPLDQGFHEFKGFLGGNVDYFHHVELSPIHVLLDGKKTVDREGYTTDLITRDAVEFIETRSENAETPFFLYLPHAAPHFPFQARDSDTTLPTKETWLDGDRSTYVKMIKALDDSVGSVISALRKHDFIENTIIVFASDHGAILPGDNGPYRDFKSTLFEGGIRVPLVAKWPGHLEGGREISDIVTLMDLTRSFLRISGSQTDESLDGLDVLHFAETGQPLEPRVLTWRARRGERTWKAIRNGDWKFVSNTDSGKTEEWLFNLKSDPYESKNLMNEESQKANRLRGDLATWESEVD